MYIDIMCSYPSWVLNLQDSFNYSAYVGFVSSNVYVSYQYAVAATFHSLGNEALQKGSPLAVFSSLHSCRRDPLKNRLRDRAVPGL